MGQVLFELRAPECTYSECAIIDCSIIVWIMCLLYASNLELILYKF